MRVKSNQIKQYKTKSNTQTHKYNTYTGSRLQISQISMFMAQSGPMSRSLVALSTIEFTISLTYRRQQTFPAKKQNLSASQKRDDSRNSSNCSDLYFLGRIWEDWSAEQPITRRRVRIYKKKCLIWLMCDNKRYRGMYDRTVNRGWWIAVVMEHVSITASSVKQGRLV